MSNLSEVRWVAEHEHVKHLADIASTVLGVLGSEVVANLRVLAVAASHSRYNTQEPTLSGPPRAPRQLSSPHEWRG